MRENFTIEELKTMESEFVKLALASIDYYTVLPLSMVCADPNTPWRVFFSKNLFFLKNMKGMMS